MKTPFVGRNLVKEAGGGPKALFVAVLEVGDGYFCVEHRFGVDWIEICVLKKRNFPSCYTVAADYKVADVVADLKAKAIEHRATLEAIQLLGVLTPLTKEEENIMAAAKLAKKETPALKGAAKTAPAKGSQAAKDKMAAIRGGRTAAEFDYKAVKGAENSTREGTWTNHMVETILAHTDTASARAANAKHKEYGDKKLDFKWAKEKGFINY